ncbi:uncharacterized protein LOC134537373 [Bacillus rossius redtenbacheri]|uniref:uncharacterized protein LOC134537373 n=1 Tax=Bacillus rossius redtenbacheri TaxID=93214 RepID=UPI002FDD5E7B
MEKINEAASQYQFPGQISGSADKKQSILKLPKRLPLQPLCFTTSEDEDTATSTMTLPHNRRVSFSVGLQIKEFHKDTEGITEGWGSSYEESLRSDSTRSSESSSSCNGSLVQLHQKSSQRSQLMLSMLTGRESAMCGMSAIAQDPPSTIVKRQEMSYQQIGSRRMCEMKSTVFQIGAAGKLSRSSTLPVRGGSKGLTSGRINAQFAGDSSNTSSGLANLWQEHVKSSHATMAPEDGYKPAERGGLDNVVELSDVLGPSEPSESKPRSCLFSPSVKYSQRVSRILDGVYTSNEHTLFEKLSEDVKEETSVYSSSISEDIPCSSPRQNCRPVASVQPTGEEDREIFFPVLTPHIKLRAPQVQSVMDSNPTTTEGQSKVDNSSSLLCGEGVSISHSIHDWGNVESHIRNMNRSKGNMSMELTDVLPQSQVNCADMSLTLTDCMELTDVLPQSQENCREMNTSLTDCRELTDLLPQSKKNCGERSVTLTDGMELTDMLPQSQVHRVEMNTTLTDCMELTDVLPQSQENCREMNTSLTDCRELTDLLPQSKKNCGERSVTLIDGRELTDRLPQCQVHRVEMNTTLTDCRELIEPIRNDIRDTREAKMLLDVFRGVPNASLGNPETIDSSAVNDSLMSMELTETHKNLVSFLSEPDFRPFNDNHPSVGGVASPAIVAGSSNTSSDCPAGRNEIPLLTGDDSAALLLSGSLDDKGHGQNHRDINLENSLKENYGDAREFQGSKGIFIRQIADSAELPRKKFKSSNVKTENEIVNLIVPKGQILDSSYGVPKQDKSSLPLASSDVSAFWQSHTNQSDTNFEDNTSRLLAAKICIEGLERYGESAHINDSSSVHLTNMVTGSNQDSEILQEVNLKDDVDASNDKVAVTGDAYQSSSCDQSILAKKDVGCHFTPQERNVVDEVQFLREHETQASSEGIVEKYENLHSAEVCSRTINSEVQVNVNHSVFTEGTVNPLSFSNHQGIDSAETACVQTASRHFTGSKDHLRSADLNCNSASVTHGDACIENVNVMEQMGVTCMNVPKSLIDSQLSLVRNYDVINQEGNGTPCSSLVCSNTSGFIQKFKFSSDLQIVDPKSNSGRENIERILIDSKLKCQTFKKPDSGDIKSGLLKNVITLCSEESHTITKMSRDCSDRTIGKENVKDTDESLTNTNYKPGGENVDDVEMPPECSNHVSSADTDSGDAGNALPVGIKESDRMGTVSASMSSDSLVTDVHTRSLTPEASQSRCLAPVSVIAGPLSENAGSVVEVVLPLTVIVESLSKCEQSGTSIAVDEERLNLQALRSSKGDIETECACVPQQELINYNGVGVSKVNGRSCDSPTRSTGETSNDENDGNLSICDSSIMEDFDLGEFPDQQNLVMSMRSSQRCYPENEIMDCVLVSTTTSEGEPRGKLALQGSVAEGANLARECDDFFMAVRENDCTISDVLCSKNNSVLVEKDTEMRETETASLFVERISGDAMLSELNVCTDPESAAEPVRERPTGTLESRASEVLAAACSSPGSCRRGGDHITHSSGTVSANTSCTSDSRHTSSRQLHCTPQHFGAVKDFLEELSKSEDCVWTIKKMDEEEWVFQFLFSSLELVLQLETENQQSPSKYRTVTDVHLKSRLTEKTDQLAHLVHYIILRKFPVDTLRSLCITVEDVPRILHHLSTEVDNMTIFMLEFDMYEKKGKLCLKDKCVTMRIPNLELLVLLEVTVDLTNWGALCKADVSARALIGSVREEDIQKLACTVAQGGNFLSQFLLTIDDYLQHLATLLK